MLFAAYGLVTLGCVLFGAYLKGCGQDFYAPLQCANIPGDMKMGWQIDYCPSSE
jgi:hypothetical protein